MNQKGFINIAIIGVVVIIIGVVGFFALQQRTELPQRTQKSSIEQPQQQQVENNTSKQTNGSVNFTVLYPPTPSSFGCNPYAGAYTTQQGTVIQTYGQWEVLYDELLKSCYTKTQAPNLVDFNKQMILAVFAGMSNANTHIRVTSISETGDRITVQSLITAGGPTLPSFSYPFTLIFLKKSDLPVDFKFESDKYPGPF